MFLRGRRAKSSLLAPADYSSFGAVFVRVMREVVGVCNAVRSVLKKLELGKSARERGRRTQQMRRAGMAKYL